MNFFLLRYILYALNVIYLIVSFVLIGVAAYVRLIAFITSINIVGGIIACGVFLFILSVIGLVGTHTHSQAVLFFYIILLFSLFLIQFSIACACLALSPNDRRTIVETAWSKSTNQTKIDMMRSLQCCGFYELDLPTSNPLGYPACKYAKLSCCATPEGQNATCCQNPDSDKLDKACPCTACWLVVEQKLERGIRVTGTVGLFFSMVELVGVWMALQFRHKRDPSIDPSTVL